jgi:hypothetical protein
MLKLNYFVLAHFAALLPNVDAPISNRGQMHAQLFSFFVFLLHFTLK